MKALNDEMEVHRVKTVKPKKLDGESDQSVMTKKKCSKCGNKHEYRNCPAFGKKCKSCQKKNHFAKMCTSKSHLSQGKRLHTVEQREDMFKSRSK